MENETKEPDNFIVCYFGNYWEGKTEQDFIDEAISENESEYIDTVLKSFVELLEQEIKWKSYLDKLNIFVENDEKGKEWIENVFRLLEKSSQHRS